MRLIALAFLAVALTACTTLIAQRIAAPPRLRAPVSGPLAKPLEKAGSQLEFFTAPNAPRIVYAVIEPGDYRLWYEFRADPGLWTYRLDYAAALKPAPRPRGTVVLLHGWSAGMTTNLHWALALAERGYRCILVDLRNHGESGAAPAGFGAREAGDVRSLLAHLRSEQRIVDPLAVLGVSMGAVAALHVAVDDPTVRAVIAIEPYANARDAVLSAGVGLAGLPSTERGIKRYFTPQRLDRIVQRLDRKLGLDLAALDTAAVLERVSMCTLIVHGQRDSLVPVHSTRALGAHLRNVQRFELPYDGHFSTPARLDVLLDPVADWIESAARDAGACPRFRAYAWAPVEGVRYIVR
jgi:pimeloyl-ACP methyl ester carboxylesterase